MNSLNTALPSCHLSLLNPFQHFLKKSDHISTALKDLALNKHPSWNTERQQLILQALNQQHHSSYSLYLKKICLNIQPSELHQLLKAATHVNPLPGALNVNTTAFQRLTKLLTIEQIEAAIRTEYPDYEGALHKAREICDSAKYYLNLTHPPTAKPLLRKLFINIIWAIDHSINTLLSAFGMTDWKELQEESNNSAHAQYRLQLILTSLTKTSAWISLAIAISGNPILGCAIVGAALLVSSAAVSLYLKFFKPIPRSIHGWRNLTTEASSGLFTGTEERLQYIDEIANTLITGIQKPKAHPMLVGPSGVGKTEILYGFAKAVAEGRYPALKGKQVFYINTTEMARKGNTYFESSNLQKIQDRIRGRNDDVILIFDEIHCACKDQKENDYLGERLQSLLEVGKDCFPHVIGSTTNQEYYEHIQPNDVFARRFKQIPIKETSRAQTLAILKKTILTHPGLYVTEEAIEAIYDLSKNNFPERPQPYTACHLLAQAIHKSKESTVAKLQLQVEEKQTALEMNLSSQLLSFGMNFLHTDSQKKFNTQNQQLHQEINLLKKQINEETENTKILQQLIDQLEKEKERALHLSIKLAVPQKKITSGALVKEFAISSYHIQAWTDALQNFILAKRKGVAHIDLSLITQLAHREHI